MKIGIDYFKHDDYLIAKSYLEDPDMGIDELGMSIHFNDFGDEIKIDDNNLGTILKVESLHNVWGIYFTNGNCLEGFHDEADLLIRMF